jgi:hypothetical protein
MPLDEGPSRIRLSDRTLAMLISERLPRISEQTGVFKPPFILLESD